MLRIRLQLPKGEAVQEYDHHDLLHDALINALIAAGAKREDIIGHRAKPWTFAPLGWHQGHKGMAYGLTISTADMELARVLTRLDPAQVVKRRWNASSVNFHAAQLHIEPDPILAGQTQLGCLMLSPLVLRDQHHQGSGKRWHKDLSKLDTQLSQIINHKLSLQAGREVNLQIHPDSLYLRANPKHSVLVNLKVFENGSKSFVIGMQAPLLLAGSEEDLRLAWYAGIGEKTRTGFGCLGLLEERLQR